MTGQADRSGVIWKRLAIALLAILLVGGLAAGLVTSRSSLRRAPTTSTLEAYRALCARLDKTVDSLNRRLAADRTPLDAQKMDKIRTDRRLATSVEPTEKIAFRVTGIVRNPNMPLVIIEDRVYGVGQEVDGFKVVRIEDDRVTFEDRRGGRQTVQLYKGEAKSKP